MKIYPIYRSFSLSRNKKIKSKPFDEISQECCRRQIHKSLHQWRYWVPIGVLRDKFYFIYGVASVIATSFIYGVTSFIFSNKFYIWRGKFYIFKQVLYLYQVLCISKDVLFEEQ